MSLRELPSRKWVPGSTSILTSVPARGVHAARALCRWSAEHPGHIDVPMVYSFAFTLWMRFADLVGAEVVLEFMLSLPDADQKPFEALSDVFQPKRIHPASTALPPRERDSSQNSSKRGRQLGNKESGGLNRSVNGVRANPFTSCVRVWVSPFHIKPLFRCPFSASLTRPAPSPAVLVVETSARWLRFPA